MGFQFKKLKILVIEDIDPMLRLVISVLDALGVGNIIAARDGNAGYALFKRENPDIVITDWHMEPVSGIELITKIRKDPDSPNKTVPIIIMTGYSALARVFEARDKGTTEFLVKPFSADGLARRIAYVINRPRDFIKTKDYFGPDRRRRTIQNYAGPKRRKTDEQFEIE